MANRLRHGSAGGFIHTRAAAVHSGKPTLVNDARLQRRGGENHREDRMRSFHPMRTRTETPVRPSTETSSAQEFRIWRGGPHDADDVPKPVDIGIAAHDFAGVSL